MMGNQTPNETKALGSTEKPLPEQSPSSSKQESKLTNLQARMGVAKDAYREQARRFAELKKEGEFELSPLISVLERAHAAIQSLDMASVIEIKSSKMPHALLRYIYDAFAILFRLRLAPVYLMSDISITKAITITFWRDSYEESGKFLLGPNFNLMKSMVEFDREQMNDETAELLEPLMVGTEEWFNIPNCRKVSFAASSLATWCFSMLEYHDRSRNLRGIRRRLLEEEMRLAEADKQLKVLELQVAKGKEGDRNTLRAQGQQGPESGNKGV